MLFKLSSSRGNIDETENQDQHTNANQTAQHHFYGWFRQTIQTEVSLQYSRAPGVHAIFGYMEVGEVIAAHGSAPLPPSLADHPHALACSGFQFSARY